MVTGIYRRKGVIKEKANGTTFIFPPTPTIFHTGTNKLNSQKH